MIFHVGGKNFLHTPMGGPELFYACRMGDQIFFAHAKGGTRKKLTTRDHKQTTPLPVKNDSSLRGFYMKIKKKTKRISRLAGLLKFGL